MGYDAPLLVPSSTRERRLANGTAVTHLQRLEAESIYIMREAVAQSENPVLLYSIGKDSSVLLHLAMKAFYPARPPFPLLHVDTTWKFREMISFRDARARALGSSFWSTSTKRGSRAASIRSCTDRMCTRM